MMFGLRSQGRGGPELTLAAALRDLDSPRPEARGLAVRNVAPALLDELGLRPPAVWQRIDHARRDEAAAALDRACADPSAQNAALACIGLAQIGAPTAEARAQAALLEAGDEHDDATVFRRECAVIALSLLGGAAQAWLSEPDSSANAEPQARRDATALVERVYLELHARLTDPRDDVRFQAGPALIEVGGARAEPELLAALDREPHPEVRANLISALAQLPHPSSATCDALARLLAGAEGAGWIGWEAALALAAARRPEAAARLVAALRSRETRDQALEALALLGEAAGPEAAAAVRPYLRGLLTPVFTQVRAAYALTRIAAQDPEGPARLDRLARHPRPAVREAVAEARALLAELDRAGDATDHSAYRRG